MLLEGDLISLLLYANKHHGNTMFPLDMYHDITVLLLFYLFIYWLYICGLLLAFLAFALM